MFPRILYPKDRRDSISDLLIFRESVGEARGPAQDHKASQCQKVRLESIFFFTSPKSVTSALSIILIR